MLTRRLLLAGGAVVLTAAAPATPITVFRIQSCTCCEGWVAAMAKAGFKPKVLTFQDITPLWRRHGVPDALSSCHMGLVDGYVTIGHVPPADVRRLLRERPKAIGVVVPGMPWGSPGMEGPHGEREAFNTLLLMRGGRTSVFARHG